MTNLSFESWPTDLTCEEADRRVRAMHDAGRAANERARECLRAAGGNKDRAFALALAQMGIS